ncbi:beta-ketoacyl synthase N-terminal-like domain-containing protein [Streptomyces sp. SL13]|uniref:Beta-ketoacyl synthase N-terminal-like domain-containing protein n=1 Tax=Streptantibioticus silvisoli TaxID=2705255 RepID=A0AA90KK91_9ACTN|nr:beta-ketoacyl synthase N-terminal-like domain-containing protein [Streptantibioticus silvisoli]MDI5974279.1 beta-ketoacyl synthase N-terminal-like domain-containing protein [Streptantibioticus silvisoli]
MTAAGERAIAVIGMSFRFPGADTPDAFWRVIEGGVNHVRRFTRDELARAGVPAEQYLDPAFVGASGVFPGITDFDAGFFGMSGNTARVTDPQQRLFIETCYHALEDGGYADTAPGTRVGVFAATGYHLYSMRNYLVSNLLAHGWEDWVAGAQITNGNHADFIATRPAYQIGLTGPAVGVQSGCSSSLSAVHLAGRSLLDGESDLALAGAAAIHVPQILGYGYVKGSILSRTGVCRAFDAAADGTVGGNGVAAVLLKRLPDALRDGDTVHAVLLGAGLNNDGNDQGRKTSFAAPSATGQQAAVSRALAAAGVAADTIGYVEAHGTGTLKGDPIEFAGLTAAHRESTDRRGYCAIGSVKPNIGHLDSCAGMAALIKTILVLRHGVIPPLANFTTPNPRLDLESSPFWIPTGPTAWPRGAHPRRAGVTALGVGGTNVHLIVEEAPPARPRPAVRPLPQLPLPVSARSAAALGEAVHRHAAHLAAHPGLAPQDIALTAGAGRRHFRHRAVVLGADTTGLAAALARPARFTGTVPERPGTTAFVFSGQGSTYPGMSRAAHDRHPVFRAALRECDATYHALTGRSLLPDLTGPGDDRVWETDLAQPALYAHQLATLRLWRELGVTPGAVAGHSVGELAALTAAGALSPADGMRLAVGRGEAMRRLSPEGGMLAVAAGRPQTDALLAAVPGLDLAVVNGEHDHVLAGPPDALRRAAALCDGHGTRSHLLAVNRAFHSRLLEPALRAWGELAATVPFAPLTTAFVSGLDGVVREPGWRPDAGHLVRQAAEPVRYDLVLARLAAGGHTAVVEAGPTGTLTAIARRAAPGVPAVATQRRGREEATLVEAAAELYCRGADIAWSALLAGTGAGRVPLPGYPFERRTYWVGPMPLPQFTEPGQAPERDAAHERTHAMRHEDRTADRITRAVTEMTVRHTGCEPADVAPDRPFVDLGADSLQMINMLREVEKEFEVRVSMRELFEEAGTPALLAALVADRVTTAPAPAATPAPAPAPFAPASFAPAPAPGWRGRPSRPPPLRPPPRRRSPPPGPRRSRRPRRPGTRNSRRSRRCTPPRRRRPRSTRRTLPPRRRPRPR